MTQDELNEAYERFAEMGGEEQAALDTLCHVLTAALVRKQKDRPVIMANRIAAMIAFEAVEAWQNAEWQRG